MNERDSWLNLEPDQQTLKDTWNALAEALVASAQDVSPVKGEYPPHPGGHPPQSFSQPLDEKFVQEHLLDDKSHAVISANAEYLTPYRIDEASDEISSFAGVDWTVHMPGTPIAIHHSIVVEMAVNGGSEQYNGYAWEQYVETLPDGSQPRVSRSGRKYSNDSMTDEDFRDALRDFRSDERILGIDDIEAIHAVAEYVRSDRR